MEYNGWKNWETWNVALWMSNTESLYLAIESRKDDLIEKYGIEDRRIVRILARFIRATCEDNFPEGTPDMRPLPGRKYARTDFLSIAEGFFD